MSRPEDILVQRVRPATGNPAGVLVLFHGRGTDENDLFDLIDALDPQRRLVGITPRGPLSLPPGGWHWYAVQRVGYPEPRTFHSTFATMVEWLAAVCTAFDISPSQLVLGGFSQGAVMAYAHALARARQRPAGVIALSGFIPTVPGFEIDLDKADGLPVAIGHGTLDPIIGSEWGRQARELLEQAGAKVTYRESDIAHTVDPRFIGELAIWLDRTMKAAA